MRAFAAVVPSDAAHTALEDFVAPRRVVESTLRWTPAHLWHITLAFVADLPAHTVDDLVEATSQIASAHAPIPLRLHGAGVFPDQSAARVAWMDVGSDDPDGHERLEELALRTRAAWDRIGLSPADGTYRPHLTLARARRPFEATHWVQVMDTHVGPSWSADEVTVFVSRRGEDQGRPHYEPVASCPLGGEAALG